MRVEAPMYVTAKLADALDIGQEGVLVFERREQQTLTLQRGEALRTHPHQLTVLVLVLLIQLLRFALHLRGFARMLQVAVDTSRFRLGTLEKHIDRSSGALCSLLCPLVALQEGALPAAGFEFLLDL